MKEFYKSNSKARVLVVGDTVLDCYIFGSVTRISPEAPVPVMHVQGRGYRPGGAGNVARNLTAVGIQTELLGVCGSDPDGAMLQELIRAEGVQCRLHESADFPTITKSRVIANHQQLLRIDEEELSDKKMPAQFLEDFHTCVKQADLVILSDYGKGVLEQAAEFIRICRKADVPVLVDPKGNNFSHYQGATGVTPNQVELEVVVGPCSSVQQLCERGERLCTDLNLQTMLITRGEHGMLLLQNGKPFVEMSAVAHEVCDVTGAGDTVIALLAAGLVSGYSMEEATAIANRGAGLVVSRLGTAVVSAEELNYGHGSKVIADLDGFGNYLQNMQAAGGKVVMTNGCFDLLHAGHTQYLQEAANQGDCLVVVVNDDASVSRLKGSDRPIIPLEQRMEALAALECVDWLFSFSEDTPERWIKRFCPDVLVKGGDYAVSQIVGADFVLEQGGRVEIIPLLPDCSSSRIIERIRNAGKKA
ncbi:MAG: bifunctional D-glycero-beta-D-manno-heptose-7-phosphate kinase/D-glycero-beta-D-manno-heptose 1-phosphate adenylyltransferase HldE [Candidatus Eutrophobiaceae bacterium]